MVGRGAVGDGPSVAPVKLPYDSAGAVPVADAEVLFLGDYSRHGHDLVIDHEGASFLVEDYFAGSGANLVGPNGAFLTSAVVEALAGPAAPGQYAQAGTAPGAAALVEIGKVVSIEGAATATHSDGVKVDLANGDPVYQGDVVQTGAGSKLGISFIDDSVFSMSADARMVLDELVFDPARAADSSMVVNLVQGSFVFVTGQIAPTGNMKVDTPVATMGIRGTTPKVLINTDLGVTEFTILPDPGSGKIGSYLLIDKTTGEILGTVESVGDKWVITSLSDEAVKVAKSGLDLLEDERALADIRDAVSNALGKRTEYDGANSFQQVAFDSSASAHSQGDGTGGNGEGSGPNGGNGGIVDPTPDKDDPPIAGDDAFTTNEDFVLVGGNVINGSGGGADVDPDGFALAVTQVNGLNLTFSGGTASVVLPANADLQTVGANLLISQNGGITYDPTSAFNYLAVGEQRIESFTYTITDKFGFTDTATVNITVQGRNDAPVITAGPVLAEIAESSESGGVGGGFTGDSLTGTLAFTDVDISDTGHVYDVISVLEQPAGGAILNPLGHDAILAMLNTLGSTDSGATGTDGTIVWTFTGTEDQFDYLAAGESVTLVYTVQVTDPHGATDTQTVTIKIVGATDGGGSNDAPVISIDTSGAFPDSAAAGRDETNAELTASGTLTVTEIDRTDEVDLSVVSVVATGTTTGIGLSNATLKAMLSLSPETVLTDTVLTSQKFTWTFDSDGQAFDYLAEGEELVLTYLVRADDGIDTGDHTVKITITGTNDAPVIAAIEQSDLDEQTGTAALTTSIDVAFGDVDLTDVEHTATITAVQATGTTTGLALTEAQLMALVTPGTVTKISGSDDGAVTLTFSAGSTAFDYLADGEVVTLTYTLEIDDHDLDGKTTRDFVVTITGTNDAPVITSAAGGADLDEAANQTGETTPLLEAGGTIAFTDVDVSENAHEVSVSVTATGVTTGLSLDNDDLKELFGTSLTQTGATGIDGSVAWTFEADDQAFDYLADDEVLTLTYTVTITDAEGATAEQDVTITIKGTNDMPVIETASSVLADTITEQTDETGSIDVLTATGTIAFSDVDVTDAHSIAAPSLVSAVWSDGVETSADVNPGTLVVHPVNQTANSAAWTYSVADDALDYLANGETLTITYSVTVKDDSDVANDTSAMQQIVITITGTNDQPMLTVDTTGGVTEDAATSNLTDTGTLSFTDVDTTDVVTPSAALLSGPTWNGGDLSTVLTPSEIAGLTSGFTVDGDRWDYSVANTLVQFLGEGETITFSYTVTATDDSGQINNSDSDVVTITITGTNDAPEIATAATLDYFRTDGARIIDAALTVVDVDSAVLLGAKVVILDYVSGEDELDFFPPVGITGSFDDVTGILTLNGPATTAEFEAALRSVTFLTSAITETDSRTIEFSVDDGDLESVVSSTTVHIFNQIVGTPAGEPLNGTEQADWISGLGGDDALFGGDGNDVLSGGDGADQLSGGDGADQLSGGDGADEFVFLAGDTGVDTIVDFDAGDDFINLESLLSGDFDPEHPQDEIRLAETALPSDDSILQVNTGTHAAPIWTDVALLNDVGVGDTINIIFDQNHEAISFANVMV